VLRKRTVKFGRFLSGLRTPSPGKKTDHYIKGKRPMTLQNIPSVMDLIDDGSALPELGLETLGILLEDAKELSAAATKVSRAIQAEVEERFKDKIRMAYAEAKRDTGTITLNEGEMSIEVTRPKKVAWDQKELCAIADRIREAGDSPSDWIDAELSVPEKRYTALPVSM
jgi:hypothetical protein